MEDLRFPVGRFAPDDAVTPEKRARWIDEVERLPGEIRKAVSGLTDTQLDTPYRDGGWTVRQVVHHLPDSHVHAYIRFKWTLTEHEPPVRAYDEKAWAELPESRGGRIEPSLALLESVHARWLMTLRAMTPSDFERALMHSENGRVTLDRMLQLYAWHGRHHAAHITALRERSGW